MTAREMTSQLMWSSSKGVSRNIHRSGLCVSACSHRPLTHTQPCCPAKVEQTAEGKKEEDQKGEFHEENASAFVSVGRKNDGIIVKPPCDPDTAEKPKLLLDVLHATADF